LNEATMFGRRYYPATYGTTPGRYLPNLLNPFRGLFGGSLMIAGIIVIINLVAPQALDNALPNWKLQYGGLIIAAVVLGFLRSIFRMFLPLAALGFWILAMFALVTTSLPTSFTLPKMPTFIAQPSTTKAVPLPESGITKPLHGSPSLPDAAYFPAQKSEGLGAASKIPGVAWIKNILR
jgi:hypothetical protein